MSRFVSFDLRLFGLALSLALASAAVLVPAARADWTEPAHHDACGPDAGPAGPSSFGEPIAAPVGARFEPTCHVGRGASRAGSTLGALAVIVGLALGARRSRRRR